MVALKGGEIQTFLRDPGRHIQAVLIYGNDTGLVTERAQGLARRLAEMSDPPGEIVRLDDTDLEADAERLDVELLTMPMFGGRKIVRVTASRRVTAPVLKALVERAGLAGFLIVEAGSLRPDEALRTLFERAQTVAALPCYGDEARDIDALISSITREAGLAISAEARAHLAARLGADRALSRAEVEKVALYALGQDTIEVEDVDAIAGDASELSLDRVVLAAASGRSDRALVECDRCIASGESPQLVIAALQRHFVRLHRIRAAIETGKSADEVLRFQRPPLHFRQRDQILAQCRQWDAARLMRAISRIAAAAESARRASDLESLHCERLLLEIGRLAGMARG